MFLVLQVQVGNLNHFIGYLQYGGSDNSRSLDLLVVVLAAAAGFFVVITVTAVAAALCCRRGAAAAAARRGDKTGGRLIKSVSADSSATNSTGTKLAGNHAKDLSNRRAVCIALLASSAIHGMKAFVWTGI